VTYPPPSALLRKYGLHAKKSWGQNFLCDEGVLRHMARLAVEEKGQRVVELGAGLGHLTARLIERGADVVAVERDRDMAMVLRGEIGDRARVVEADAAQLDYRALAAGGKLAVVGNLPYHLTSSILFSVLDAPQVLSRAIFLLQREVAERLAAGPGTKAWGLLSVLLQQRARVQLERRVAPSAFLPQPRVESAVLQMDFGPPRVAVADEGRFGRLVKAGFAQRRKMLSNALAAGRVASPDKVVAALRVAGIDPHRRGETLSVEEWAALDRALEDDARG